MKNQPEKRLVIRPLTAKLHFYMLTGDVVWFQRLVAEDDIHCKAGTSDFVVVVNCMDGRIALLFIEAKKPGVKRLRFEQNKFFQSMEGSPMTMCAVVNNPDQLWGLIKKCRNL